MPTDEELARDVQRGHQAALEVLVHRYHGPILAYVYRLIRQWQTAEDLAQECFVHLLAGIGGYRYPRPFKPWLYTIAINACRDYAKQAYVRRVEPRPAPGEDAPSADTDRPDNVLEFNEARRAVLLALDRLTQIQREIVVLHLYQELTLTEAAEALGIPVGTAKSRLAAALQSLRSLLAAEGLLEGPPRTVRQATTAGEEGER